MRTLTGLFIKCDKEADLFHITRQSAARGCEKVMEGRLAIYSCGYIECMPMHEIFYLDGNDSDGQEDYEEHIPFIESFFETIIFPQVITRESGFNYLRNVVL